MKSELKADLVEILSFAIPAAFMISVILSGAVVTGIVLLHG